MKEKQVQTYPNEETNMGKFKSAEELLSAYNALEREFTKRCQLISELQASLASSKSVQADGKTDSAQSDKECAPSETADKSTQADAQAQEIVKSEKASLDAQSEIAKFAENRKAAATEHIDALSYAALHAEELSEVPEVMEACIERYKRKIIAAGSVPSPEGMAVIVPAKRPKTLADAKLLADSMLDKF